MEENEKMKVENNSENVVNQQNGNSEVKPKNKKVTIVLVVLIILLILAIGICASLWFAGDTTKIINNKEEVVKEENDKTEENTNSSQNSTNEDNKNNTNVGSISNIFNTELKNIEEAAIAKQDVSFNDSSAILSTDINNDGKSDILKVEQIIDNEGMYRDGYKLFFNDEMFFSTEDNTIQGAFRYLSKIYIVDLDSADNYLDLVLLGDFASADYGYIIFKYNRTTFEPIIDSSNNHIFELMGNSMYIDNKGILVPQDGVFVNTNPILSDIYYSYRENKVYEVPMGNYTNELIEFKNVYFTTDLKNIDNYMESTSIENDKDNGEILISEGIYVYKNVKAYIVEDNNDNYVSDCMIKVKLEDGRLGYIFVADGVLAG